jgi:glycosyltransferase involved in cell wall biosynthesis
MSNNRKKIAFVVFEPQLSGQGRAVADIFSRINPEFSSILICQKTNTGLYNLGKSLTEGALAIRISKLINYDLIKAYRFIKTQNVSLIHLHGFEGLLWGHALAIMLRIPIVFTPHTIDMRNRFFFFLYNIVWKICARYASMYVTVSYEDAKTIVRRKIIPAARVRTILLGIDRSRFENLPLPGAPVVNPDGAKLIVQVGHLAYQKNPFCLVKAAAMLLPGNPDMKFIFVGEGPLRSSLETEILRKGLENRVMVLGHRNDALSITKHAWLVVNSSRWEGMPFTLIDACFMGKAIVASAVNGIKDLVEDGVTGLLFTPGRAQELAQKINILACNDSLREQLGKSAMESIRGKHSMGEMGRLHCEMYKEVLRRQ